MKSPTLRWGILSTGTIAHTFSHGVAASHSGRLVAVAGRSAGPATAAFAAEFGGLRAHGDYAALLADPEIDAVYLGMLHPQHAEWAIRAAQAGKHVLCEKPLTLRHADSQRVIDAARAAGVTLMEAYMYRCHPQTAQVADLVRRGRLGEIALIEARFGFHCDFQSGHRLFARELGGGGILDVGGYPVSFARLVAGAARGAAFADPVAVHGGGQLQPETRVDVHAAATLDFGGGLVAQVACGIGAELDNTVTIYGTAGSLHVPAPWFPSRRDNRETSLVLRLRGRAAETIRVAGDRELYTYEADAFAAAVSAGQREVAAMSWADSLGNARALDAWRAAVGVRYDGDA